MEPVLNVAHLRVQLDGNVLIPDMTFSVDTNQTLVVLGPNGAGKTVLLKALLGILPHTGEVSWRKNVKIAYVPQRVPLTRDLPITVEDFFSLKGTSPTSTSDALKEVGITDPVFLQKQLGYLSSGQFQRVLIAWALSKDPDVLLFDEPTAGIDIGGEETIHDLLRKLRGERNLTVILVTHDLTTVYSEAIAVLCMNAKTFCFGPPKEILDPETLKRIYGKDIKFFRHAHG